MSFNDFKNNTEILKKYLFRMNSLTQSQIKPQWIEQTFLKQNNPHIFLQILHYVLIKFSPSVLFVKVLDFYPTIKDDNDKKFVTNAIILARKIFDIEAKIDIQQFLSSKFVQKKTEFMSCFCKAAYEFHQKEAKPISNVKSGVNGLKKENDLSSQVPSRIPNRQVINEDSDEENPRNLNLVPSSTTRPQIRKQILEDSSEDEDLKQLINKKKQLSKIRDKNFDNNPKKIPKQNYPNNQPSQHTSAPDRKANVFPKTLPKFAQEYDDICAQQSKIDNKKTVTKYQTKNQRPKRQQQSISNPTFNKRILQGPTIQQPDQIGNQNGFDASDYVTRDQFMEIVTGMSRNFTQLLTKFNDFQSQVSGWVQNVNAKISILEENVKTIKNNI